MAPGPNGAPAPVGPDEELPPPAPSSDAAPEAELTPELPAPELPAAELPAPEPPASELPTGVELTLWAGEGATGLEGAGVECVTDRTGSALVSDLVLAIGVR
jgi:hypothetical protein